MEPQGPLIFIKIFIWLQKKKHPHFYHTGTKTHADFAVTGLQDKMLNKQFQYFTIFTDKK